LDACSRTYALAFKQPLRSPARPILSVVFSSNCKKSWQNGVIHPIFAQINASPDDIRKAAVADARRTLESAAHFTRGGGAPAPDHDADYACRAGRIEAEQRRLIQWAKENEKLASSGRLPPVFAQGGEHDVFFQKRTRRYLKATRQDRHKGYGIALGSHTLHQRSGDQERRQDFKSSLSL